jgi:hypothetical protein
MKYIDITIFITSLSLGLMLNYISSKPPKIIYIYPTPENYDKTQLKDDSNTCFGLRQKEVICPNNEKDVFKIPFQG